MGISHKYLAVLATLFALVVAPVALGSGGAKATATPTSVKVGKSVELKVTGLKAGERVKAAELIVATGQKRTLYPRQRASSAGVIIVTLRAQIKGRHKWTFTGRQSRRTAVTNYTVK
jgi:hypothetical protein